MKFLLTRLSLIPFYLRPSWMAGMLATQEQLSVSLSKGQGVEKRAVRQAQHERSKTLIASGLIVMALVSLGLSGCMWMHPSYPEYGPTLPEDPAETRQVNGAIYQAHHDMVLFENSVANRVGDILTIVLTESTSASKKSSTNTKKATNASLGADTTVFGRPITSGGNNILSAGIGDSSDFTGEGNSAQSNTLAGEITVTIAKRYSNGNLLVRGQKWISINQGREYVRVEGIVRQADIQPDNTVPSSKVANASIAYGGQGALADANSKGWLARFFDSPLTPF